MASKYIPPHDRVIRYVSWARLRKNAEETEVYGPLPSAFQLRENEEYLSVTWCEYYNGDADATLRCAAEAIRNSMKVAPKARFAIAEVKEVTDFFRAAVNRRVRFVHEPTDQNQAHCAVRGWYCDDLQLLEKLAGEIWNETLGRPDIDQLPISECRPRLL